MEKHYNLHVFAYNRDRVDNYLHALKAVSVRYKMDIQEALEHDFLVTANDIMGELVIINELYMKLEASRNEIDDLFNESEGDDDGETQPEATDN